jgi:hypothetical protein
MIRCSDSAVAEDEQGKEGEAGDLPGRRCSLTRPCEAAGRPTDTGEREVL